MTKRKAEIITYIFFAIFLIANTILSYKMALNPNDEVIILPFLFVCIAFVTTFYLLLYLDKKEAFFISLIAIIVQIILLFLNISDDLNKFCYGILAYEVFAYITKSVEYFKIFTMKDYISKRDKRWIKKEMEKQATINWKEKQTELKKEKEINIAEVYNKTKEISFKDTGESCILYYKVDFTKSNGMLLSVGKVDGPLYYGDYVYIGNDDYSSDGIFVRENHAIIEERYDKQYYFDLNDLDHVTIIELHNAAGYEAYNIEIHLKDKTEREFGYFDDLEYLDDFINYLKNNYPNINLIDRVTYEDATYVISDDIKVTPCPNKDFPEDSNEEIESIKWEDIEKKEIKGDNTIRLYLKNTKEYEFYKMDPDSYNQLIEKLKEIGF